MCGVPKGPPHHEVKLTALTGGRVITTSMDAVLVRVRRLPPPLADEQRPFLLIGIESSGEKATTPPRHHASCPLERWSQSCAGWVVWPSGRKCVVEHVCVLLEISKYQYYLPPGPGTRGPARKRPAMTAYYSVCGNPNSR